VGQGVSLIRAIKYIGEFVGAGDEMIDHIHPNGRGQCRPAPGRLDRRYELRRRRRLVPGDFLQAAPEQPLDADLNAMTFDADGTFDKGGIH
jgi:hypothetical protein